MSEYDLLQLLEECGYETSDENLTLLEDILSRIQSRKAGAEAARIGFDRTNFDEKDERTQKRILKRKNKNEKLINKLKSRGKLNGDDYGTAYTHVSKKIDDKFNRKSTKRISKGDITDDDLLKDEIKRDKLNQEERVVQKLKLKYGTSGGISESINLEEGLIKAIIKKIK